MNDLILLVVVSVFIVLTFVTAFIFAMTIWIAYDLSKEWHDLSKEWTEVMELRRQYEYSIERSNEAVIVKFRHDLDCPMNKNIV